MATIVNARDIQLQATSPRMVNVLENDNVFIPALKGVVLTAPSTVFQVNDAGSPSPTSIVLTATNRQVTGAISWSIVAGTATLTSVTTTSPASATLQYTDLTSPSATIRASVTESGITYYSDFTIAAVADGVDGTAGVAYWLTRSAGAVTLNTDNTYSPPNVTLASFESIGASAPASYNGRFTVETTVNGTTWTLRYTSAADEASTTYTPPSGIVAIRGRLYQAGGTTTLLDELVIPIVSDGTDAITVSLSNASHTVPADVGGVVSSYTNSGTTIEVWEGATKLTFTTGTLLPQDFQIGTPTVNPSSSITVGSITGNGTLVATVGQHSGMSALTSTLKISYPITVKRANGTTVSVTATQTITKASAGVRGAMAGNGLTFGIRAPNSQWDDNLANRVVENMATGATLTSGLAAGSMTAPGLRIGDEVTLTNGPPWVATQGTWSSATTYNQNDYVIKTNVLYRALAGSTNQDPATATAYWLQLGASTNRTTWATSTVYNQYDRLTDSSIVYVTLWTKHTSASSGTFANEQATAAVSVTKYWTGGAWSFYGQVIDGNLLVRGSVSAWAIYTNYLSSITANLGAVTIDSTGYVRGGATDYATGIGFFLGYSGAAYKFSVGDPSGNILKWDGSVLTVVGALTGAASINITGTANFGGSGSNLGVTVAVIANASGAALDGVHGLTVSGTGVRGDSTGTGVNAGIGVSGTAGSGGTGVSGFAPAGIGVFGESNGAGAGVEGKQSSTSGNGGVFFNTAASTSGRVGAGNGWNFYADGSSASDYGTFTGGHDAVMLLDDPIEEGDIVVDAEIVAKFGMSMTISRVTRSTRPNQKGVAGAFAGAPSNWDDFTPTALYHCPDAYYAVKDTTRPVIYNALGEGQINVCGEGGDIENGDLIVSSSTPGKGMKQADDIIRSYTVAKARETVTFSSPDEVKQIACYYVSG